MEDEEARPTLPPVHLAAGGLLRRQRAGRLEIAVVWRRRYGMGGAGDHSLPKGHVEPGEGFPEAALREVLEETGCTGRIDGAALSTSYMIGEVPKLVVYYPMLCLSEGPPSDAGEVAAVQWLTPEEALARLSYASERALVREAFGLSPAAGR